MRIVGGVALIVFAGCLVAPDAAAQIGFNKLFYETGPDAFALATGDFDEDGRLDIAVGNLTTGTISIFRNFSGSSFGTNGAVFPTGQGVRNIVVADFNNDGHLDVAGTQPASNTVFLLRGDGRGTLGNLSTLAAPASPFAITAADFNRDGLPDLAIVASPAATASVFLATGGGQFGTRQDFSVRSEPRAILARDFNGDGRLDLATANAGAASVTILNGGGDGTFQVQGSFGTGIRPVALTAADFNLDNRLDVVAANSISRHASILAGNSSGSFDPAVDLGMDTTPIALEAVDFNNDGKPDLAAAGLYFYYYYALPIASNISVHMGRGDGSFAPRTSLRLNVVREITSADFNGDGFLDLAATVEGSIGLWVLLQVPQNISASAVNPFGLIPVGATSPPQSITFSNLGSVPVTISSQILGGSFQKVSDTCAGTPVAAGATCRVELTMTPSSAGVQIATLMATESVSGMSLAISLVGTGVAGPPPDFRLEPVSGAGSAQAGGTASVTVRLTPVNGFTGNVAFSCSSLPQGWRCGFQPASVTLDGVSSPQVRVDVVTTRTSLLPPGVRINARPIAPQILLLVFAILALFAYLNHAAARGRWRRIRRCTAGIAAVAAAILMLAATGCGGGGATPPPTLPPPAPATTSRTVTVVATSGSTIRSLDLTINVL